MKKLSDIFDTWYGVNLEVVNCRIVEKGIPFVSRQSVNNGVVCDVCKIDDIKPNPANTLSIAVSGSVLSTFYHSYEYYSGRDIYIAKPRTEMSKEVMIFYASLIEKNKFRYNYGRGANKTFRDILLPDVETITKLVKKIRILTTIKKTPITERNIKINSDNWQWFRYDEIFEIRKGFYNKKPEIHTGTEIPFIGAIDSNNGISDYYSLEDIETSSKTGDDKNADIKDKIFEGGCITVSNNGSVGYAFYQDKRFTCTHDVNPLYIHPKWNVKMSRFVGLFLCTLIEKEKFRWTYGRKWRPKRMPDSLIKLPVDENKNPDWTFMENFMKTLPFSTNLL